METINKFVNELKKTFDYSKKTKVKSEKWGEVLYRVTISNISILYIDTIEVLAKWQIQEFYRDTDGNYIIIIEF